MDASDDLNGYSDGLTRVFRKINGREILFDKDGYLWEMEDWSEELALFLAGENGLTELTETHWMVIRFLRIFFEENGRAPLNRDIRSATGLTLLVLKELFPGGMLESARVVAGLPNPRNCNG